MSQAFMPPGAFLSSGTEATLNPWPTAGNSAGWMPYPTHGNSAGWMPYPTHGNSAAWMPYPTHGNSAAWMPYPTHGTNAATMPYPTHRNLASLGPDALRANEGAAFPVHPSTAAPWPWQGIDPAWVYSGAAEPLLAQALRKVQAKIVRNSDPRLEAPTAAHAATEPDKADPLWRWQGQFRVKAVVADLLARFFVDGTTVWAAQRVQGQPDIEIKATRLFVLQPPGTAFDYGEQIDKVVRSAIEREDRLPEILSQNTDFHAFFNCITGLDRIPAAHVAELLEVAWDWSTHLVMMLKNNVAERRPVQRSALVMPVIGTPGHGSLPSGHATLAALTSTVLSALLYPGGGPRVGMLDRLARRIAFNRVVAGVHFPMDSMVGYELGRQLGHAFVATACGAALPGSIPCPVTVDSELREEAKLARHRPPETAPAAPGLLASLWRAAQGELAQQRI